MSGSTPVDVDAALRSLAASLDLPPAPDYASRVLTVLADPDAPRPPRVRGPGPTRVSKLLVAAAVLLLAVATTIAVPSARHALASWFGFTGIDIRSAPSSASPLPLGPVPIRAGHRITLEEARTVSRGRLTVPSGLPTPDRVYKQVNSGATVVTLCYLAAPGLAQTQDTGFALLVTEIFDAGEPVLVKMVGTGANSTRVKVHDADGIFIHGPQELVILDHTRISHGEDLLHEVAARESADTLIWGDPSGTYRIEADMSRAQAIALAETLR